jgi:PleD family two-component response regulator
VVAAVRGVRAQVRDALRAAGWTATETQDARSALNAAVHTKPDAVVADLDMPGLDLSALLSGISASAEAGGVPIVGLSSTRGGPADALRAGVADFARKPVDPSEVAVRVVAAAQRQRHLNGLRRMALFDVLTGLYNRRHMLDQLRVLAAIAARRGDDFAAILVDETGSSE